MSEKSEKHPRKSRTALGKIYFWTATIHKWYHLLTPDENKSVLLNSLKELSDRGCLTIFAFVIMPNHIHLIFRQNKLNGKETPKGSFLKKTGHELLLCLKAKGKAHYYQVNLANKSHEIWQRDSLAVEIYSRKVAEQKLKYIHLNPVSKKWMLAKDDIDYFYTSARFYETQVDDFGFLNNLYEVFDGK